MRLIGTIYFRKYATAFEVTSPVTHFLTFALGSPRQQHEIWLEDIRQNIWDCIKFENEMIPSNEALNLHWQRSCWVIHMWAQADQNTMILQPITDYGWTLTDGSNLTVVWDSPNNIEAIRESELTIEGVQVCYRLQHSEVWVQKEKQAML